MTPYQYAGIIASGFARLPMAGYVPTWIDKNKETYIDLLERNFQQMQIKKGRLVEQDWRDLFSLIRRLYI